MFIVEWQRGGKTVHREPMLGANLADVLRIAVGEAAEIVAKHGSLDTVRIQDTYRNETTIHELAASNA